jgi:membrane-associated phospholipid phosphatase
MWQPIRNQRLFFISFSAFLVAGLMILLLFSKEESFLLVNQSHSKFLDYLFYYATRLGKGSMYVVLLIAALFMRYGYVVTVGAAAGIQTLLVHVPKRLIFPDALRPIRHFDGLADLHILENVKVHAHYSFPSGHTATAFCLFTLLAIFLNKRQWELPLFFLALMVAYSRIYLAQHFFVDVYVGSLIGVVSALFAYWLINTAPMALSGKWAWLDKKLDLRRFMTGRAG